MQEFFVSGFDLLMFTGNRPAERNFAFFRKGSSFISEKGKISLSWAFLSVFNQ
jgi:hypothetical protein